MVDGDVRAGSGALDELCVVGLVMAGGRGSRMRSSGIDISKPLLPVGGVTLLERNLHALVRAGASTVAVSVSSLVPEVGHFAADHLSEVATAAGVTLEICAETAPMGNIGAAGALRHHDRPVLVTFADNLTLIDLAAVARLHVDTGADLTLAAHEEPVRLPYGELTVEGAEVTGYVEKPVRRSLVASAVCVLGPGVVRSLPEDRPTGLVDLFHSVRGSGGRVAAFCHEAPWVDVNDSTALGRAEELVAHHQPTLDRWLPGTPREVTVQMALRGGSVALGPDGGGGWTLPEVASPGGHVGVAFAFDAVGRDGPVRCCVVLPGPLPDDVPHGGRWVPLAAGVVETWDRADVMVDEDVVVDEVTRRALALAPLLVPSAGSAVEGGEDR